jgi:hypothetical protein
MGKFILLFRGSNVYQSDQSPEALQALTIKMMNWLDKLSENGKHFASERFHRTGKQVNGTNKMIIDNPFGDDKEIIGGCTIVLAKDFNGAVEIAKACPILETNATIEIRAIQSV